MAIIRREVGEQKIEISRRYPRSGNDIQVENFTNWLVLLSSLLKTHFVFSPISVTFLPNSIDTWHQTFSTQAKPSFNSDWYRAHWHVISLAEAINFFDLTHFRGEAWNWDRKKCRARKTKTRFNDSKKFFRQGHKIPHKFVYSSSAFSYFRYVESRHLLPLLLSLL